MKNMIVLSPHMQMPIRAMQKKAKVFEVSKKMKSPRKTMKGHERKGSC